MISYVIWAGIIHGVPLCSTDVCVYMGLFWKVVYVALY